VFTHIRKRVKSVKTNTYIGMTYAI